MKRYLWLAAVLLLASPVYTQPLDLERVWMQQTNLSIRNIESQDGYLYVSGSNNTAGADFAALDISNPQGIFIAGLLDLNLSQSKALAVEGNFAVVIYYNNLLAAIDITDPQQPVLVTTVQNPGSVIDFQASDGNLFLYDSLGYLRCYSMSDISQISAIAIGNTYSSLALYEGYAYLSGDNPGFRCLNVSQPDAMVDLGSTGDAMYQNIEVAESGYLICYSYGSVSFYDLATPGQPSFVLDWDVPSTCDRYSIDADAGRMTVTSTFFEPGPGDDYPVNDLFVWDLVSAELPQLIYSMLTTFPDVVDTVALEQGRLALLNTSGILRIYDVSSDSETVCGGYFIEGKVYNVEANDSQLFTNIGGKCWNIYNRNGEIPEMLHRITLNNIGVIAATNQNLFVGVSYYSGDGGPTSSRMFYYSLQGQNPPIELGNGYWGLGSILDFRIVQDKAYLLSDRRFAVYDIANVNNPQELFSIEGDFYAMDIQGQYVYLTGYQEGDRIAVYDISQPSDVQLAGELYPGRYLDYSCAAVWDDVLFTGYQLNAFDVSQPDAIEHISQFPIFGGNLGLATYENSLVVLGANNLNIYNVSSLQQPQLVARCSFTSRAYDMVIRDSLAYVGHEDYVACYDLREALQSNAIDPTLENAPKIFAYPNPSYGNTTLSLELRDAGEYEVTIYNIRGQAVRRFPGQNFPSGISTLSLDGEAGLGNSLPSGIYLICAQNERSLITSKLILMK